MSRTPNSSREETHERILDVASRSIRAKGYAGVGVADVMKQAGLTHGGFYAHFESRDALLIEALERANLDSERIVERMVKTHRGRGDSQFKLLVDAYLSNDFLKGRDQGCPVAALAGEMPRQSQAVRKASVRLIEIMISNVQAVLPESDRTDAMAIASAMVGALQLARALGDSPNGRAVLAATRKSLVRHFVQPLADRSV